MIKESYPKDLAITSSAPIDAVGRTSYHAAIQHNDVTRMKEMVTCGCDVYCVAKVENVPFHILFDIAPYNRMETLHYTSPHLGMLRMLLEVY